MSQTKTRQHNEWFRQISLSNRKSCPTCRQKLTSGESLWSWGEYVHGKWRTVKHFCYKCFHDEVATLLVSHTTGCGCEVNLICREVSKPEWMRL